MVSGHSYLPHDRNFGIVEAARRRTQHLYILQHSFPTSTATTLQNVGKL